MSTLYTSWDTMTPCRTESLLNSATKTTPVGKGVGLRLFRHLFRHAIGSDLEGLGLGLPWFLVGNEGMRALFHPLNGVYRALIPSFPTKSRGLGCRVFRV